MRIASGILANAGDRRETLRCTIRQHGETIAKAESTRPQHRKEGGDRW